MINSKISAFRKLFLRFAKMLLILALFMPSQAIFAGADYTSTFTLTAKVSSNGGGKVYFDSNTPASSASKSNTGEPEGTIKTTYPNVSVSGAYATPDIGYKFAGWGSSDKGTNLGNSNPITRSYQFARDDYSSSNKPTKSETIYATFEETDYNVTFHSNNPNKETTVTKTFRGARSQSFTAAQLGFETPTADFTFDSWNTKADGSGQSYSSSNIKSVQDGHLYAQWRHIHDGIKFAPWYSTTTLPSSGSYALVNNVTSTGEISWRNSTLNLCLLGKTVSCLYCFLNGGELNIYDCKDNQGCIRITSNDQPTLQVVGGGNFNMYGGHMFGITTNSNTPTLRITQGDAGIHGGIIESQYSSAISIHDATSTLLIDNGAQIFSTAPSLTQNTSAAIRCIQGFAGTITITGDPSASPEENTSIKQTNPDALTYYLHQRDISNTKHITIYDAEVGDYGVDRAVVETGNICKDLTNAPTFVCYGPYNPVSLGYYTVEFKFDHPISGTYDICTDKGKTIIYQDVPFNETKDLTIYFGLNNTTEDIEARIKTTAEVAANTTCTQRIITRLYTYTIHLDKQGGTGGNDYCYNSHDKTYVGEVGSGTYVDLNPGMFSESMCLAENKQIELPTRTGYTFNGYFTSTNGQGTKIINADGTFAVDKVKVNKAEDVIIYAYWIPNQYNVTLDQQGGTGGTTSVTATYDAAMPSATMPTRSGYIFGGYYDQTGGNGTKYYNADGSSAHIWDKTGNQTLYANWTPITYTVTYDGNGATGGSTANSSHTYDVAKNLTTNGYERKYTVTYNYNGGNGSPESAIATSTFAGWAETANGDKKYNDKQSVTNLSSTQDAVVTLYAKWNSGSVTLPSPTRDGHDFAGWYSDSGLTNKVGDAGASYTPTANATLYAKWTAKQYTLTWELNGGTIDDSKTYTKAGKVICGTTLVSPTVTKTGYNHTGWTPAVAATMPAADVTYTATYTAIQYTVTLDQQGGTGGTTSVTATYDAAMPSATMPTKEGFDFGGYYDQTNGAGTQYYKSDGSSAHIWDKAGNQTLYAYWTPKKYNLKWNTNGGTILSNEDEYTPEGKVANGTTLVAPTIEKSCAVFKGWSPSVPATMPAEDVTYTAQWQEDSFTFDNNSGDGKWETYGNWLHNSVRAKDNTELPNKYSKVTINATCVLSTKQHVGGITMNTNGNLTITPEGGLTIDECGMEGLTKDNFTLQSDADNGTGYVRMHPTYSEEKVPTATVQMYSKAYFEADDNDPNATATWQYIGTAVQTNEILGNLFYGDALEEWNEKIGNWDYCGNYDKMQLFKGYAYSQCKSTDGKTQTYQGDLVSGNQTITLACEGTKFEFTADEQKIYEISASLGKGGFNLLANSFSAPIDATQFDLENDFSGDVDKTLYVYNTGSFNSWKSQIGGGKQTQFGVSVGQYINIPLGAVKHMDNPLLDVIPSMQAFFIQALKPNAKINLNYERLIWDGDYVKHSNKPMRVAARNQANADNGLSARIQITVTGSGQTDKIYLFEGDEFSAEYDNGYDSRKLMGSKDVPQLYVKTADNKFAFFASDDINNSYIGLRTALSDSIINYTFTFDGIIGDEYELYDSQLGIATPIYNGSSYSFTAEGGIKIEQRFVIRKKPGSNTGIDNQYADNAAILLRHEGDFVRAVEKSGNAQTLEIFDAQGRLIMSEPYTFSTTIDISTLPAGTYVARTANEVLKLIK